MEKFLRPEKIKRFLDQKKLKDFWNRKIKRFLDQKKLKDFWTRKNQKIFRPEKNKRFLDPVRKNTKGLEKTAKKG